MKGYKQRMACRGPGQTRYGKKVAGIQEACENGQMRVDLRDVSCRSE